MQSANFKFYSVRKSAPVFQRHKTYSRTSNFWNVSAQKPFILRKILTV